MKGWVALLLLGFVGFATAGIVNPDVPNHVGAFHERMAAYQQRILDGRTTLSMDRASGSMAEALDDELNEAYRRVMARLSEPQQSALRASQRQWLHYRDAEYAFLDQTFTREVYGSSYALALTGARNALVYERAEELWGYLEQLY